MTNFEDDGKTDGVNVFDFKVLGKLSKNYGGLSPVSGLQVLNPKLNYSHCFTDPDVQELINSAIEVRKRAYCPYSGE